MRGETEYRDILDDWVVQILKLTSSSTDFSKYTVVADGGNGVA